MSENLEIEFKTLLSIEEFSRIIDYFQLKEEQFFTQTNYYFDSADFQLKKKHIGLRVRILSKNAEITLKIPEKVGLLEINDALSIEEAHQIVESTSLPNSGNVYNKLTTLGIDKDDLRLIGNLTTKRAEIKLPQGLLALDESWYNEQHDFELELEVDDDVNGKRDFLALLDTLTIKESPSPNKIQRMMLSSKEKD
ncbi:CYTH domain-containing protein [Enterococcus ureasiticus]|uniref:Adenylate cyclase n=1 Tax=Enterococcus ureasiticus TaxID=903984 RepID=A0A1E5GNK2_9ENTE|nr:CYTH domain-containing protein [Enterococcus ureasiticus]OEG14185.1 adenylate cyclase [Enterococcus ureasiticus]